MTPAQSPTSVDDSTKEFIDFAIAAGFHDELIRSIQAQCPSYRFTLPFNSNVLEEAKRQQAEVGNMLERIVSGTKPLAKAHAAQIVINAGGCDTKYFKSSIEHIESHQAMLAMRALQRRYR